MLQWNSIKTAVIGAVKKYGPAVSIVAGAIGLGTAGYLTYEAVRNVKEDFNEFKEIRDEVEETTEEGTPERKDAVKKTYIHTVKKVVTHIWKPVGLFAVSVVAIAVPTLNLYKDLAKVSATLAAVSQTFADYRNRVVAAEGTEADLNYRYGITKKDITVTDENGEEKTLKNAKVMEPAKKPDDYEFTILFQPGNVFYKKDRTFNVAHVNNVVEHAQKMLMSRAAKADNGIGSLTINELIYELGWDQVCKEGFTWGYVWDKNDPNSQDTIDIKIVDYWKEEWTKQGYVNNEPVLLLKIRNAHIISDRVPSYDKTFETALPFAAL